MITFNDVGINYITESLEIKKAQNHRNSPIIGQDGSDISFISSDAIIISCKSLCLDTELSTDGSTNRINQYIQLSQTYNKTSAPLSLDSATNDLVKGNYFITGFDYSEDTMGNFTINWEFTQEVKFNVTQKTFRVWNKKQALSNAKKTSSNGLDSNTKKLLKDCNTLNTKSNNSKCIKCLQTFLQKQGYFTKHKVDGNYGSNTANAVKSLQKKYKLKTTGEWDIPTRLYFQTKYKYPTITTKDVNGKSTVVGSTVKKASKKSTKKSKSKKK